MKEVIITVTGGVAEVHSASPGINVKIVDFDIDGVDEKLLDDFMGSACVISEHESVPVLKEVNEDEELKEHQRGGLAHPHEFLRKKK